MRPVFDVITELEVSANRLVERDEINRVGRALERVLGGDFSGSVQLNYHLGRYKKGVKTESFTAVPSEKSEG